MALQKAGYRCFAGIRPLHCVFNKFFRPALSCAVKAVYRVLPVSYSNMGIVDHNRLYFKNSDVVSCSLAGTFRLPPDFQLTISAFRGVCTFNCTLAGSAGDDIIGQQILEQVKSELLAWLTE